MKILLISKNPLLRGNVANATHRAGYAGVEWVESDSCSEGLERLNKEAFDLVISDWGTTDMDGQEFILTIRANPGLKGIPVLFMVRRGTAIADEPRYGKVSFLVKPFTYDALREHIVRLMD